MAGYGTDEGFAAWAAGAGHSVPAGTVATARQRGSDYIDGLYGRRFSGRPAGGGAQEREWPRSGAVDYHGQSVPSDAVPERVVNAAYEATLIELTSPGSLSVMLTPDQRKVLTKVDRIEWEVVAGGTGNGIADATPTSTRIEGLLWPLLVRTDEPAIMVV